MNREFWSSAGGFVLLQLIAVLCAVALIYFSERKRR